jgi:hypothetical protein
MAKLEDKGGCKWAQGVSEVWQPISQQPSEDRHGEDVQNRDDRERLTLNSASVLQQDIA